MNLTTEPWIPVTDSAGNPKKVSLRQVFTEGDKLRDLAVRPHERVALMRLFICIAQAALKGPADSDALEHALRKLPKEADDYLVKWQDCFDLFHPTKPFLQFAGLTKPPKPPKKRAGKAKTDDEEESKTASKLDFALATGNNATLFDHGAASDQPRTFPPGQLALMLITFQCFAPSQPAASLLLNGELVPSKDGKAPKDGKTYCGHAPCLPGAMLHTFVRRASLLSTIAGNLVSSSTVDSLYRKGGWGKPVWESMPGSFVDRASAAIGNATQTYVGRLVPLSRVIQIQANCQDVLVANGLDYPSAVETKKKTGAPNPFPKFPPEPSASLGWSENAGFRVVGAGSRATWRELAAITVKRAASQPCGPLIFSELDTDQEFDLWVGALVATKDEGFVDAVESVYAIPSRMFSNVGRETYEAEIKHSERMASKLGNACKRYREHLEVKSKKEIAKSYDNAIKGKNKGNQFPEAKKALRYYWNTVEQRAPLLLDHLRAEDGSEEAAAKLKLWRSSLWRAAHEAFRAACPSETPRQQRAHALALHTLQYSQRKQSHETTASQEAA